MKVCFKYGDVVKVDSEFYGKIKGTVIGYQKGENLIFYTVQFMKCGELLAEQFYECELIKI